MTDPRNDLVCSEAVMRCPGSRSVLYGFSPLPSWAIIKIQTKMRKLFARSLKELLVLTFVPLSQRANSSHSSENKSNHERS